MYPLLKSLQNPPLSLHTHWRLRSVFTIRPRCASYLPNCGCRKCFLTLRKRWGFLWAQGWCHSCFAQHCKGKSYSYRTKTLFARCLKQWVTKAAVHGTLLISITTCRSPSYKSSLLPPLGLLPPSMWLRPTLPPFSTPSSFLPLEAAWGLLPVASSKAHPTVWHSPHTAAVHVFKAFIWHFPQNGACRTPAPQKYTIFFLPVTKPGEKAVRALHFQTANSQHISHILQVSHTTFTVISVWLLFLLLFCHYI